MSRRDSDLLIADILDAVERIRSYTQGLTIEDFLADSKTSDAVVRNLEVIGEAVKQLPEDWLTEHPEVPWHQIAGLRNRIVHAYFGVDLPPDQLKLAEYLGETWHCSPLLRKGRRLGLDSRADAIAVARARGALHYAASSTAEDPGSDILPDEELVALLLIGEGDADFNAVRCAAQLLRSPHIEPDRMGRVARMERIESVLADIARKGIAHDPKGRGFWRALSEAVGGVKVFEEGVLPHWSRYVTMRGFRPGQQGIEHEWIRPVGQ